MEASGSIGVFDSGLGGLTVVKEIKDLLPLERVFYFGDTARLPYGTKSQEVVLAYSKEITAFLLDRGAKIIVVACNTATAASLNQLREHWPEVPFIGMEPAVKPGAQATKSGVVAVLATAGTFRSQRYSSLMERFGKDVELVENPCLGLVELIEAGLGGSSEMESFLREILEPMMAAKADTFVLGCTHYPFIQEDIRKIVGPKASIINPAPAIARQLQRRLQKRELLAPQKPAEDQFFFSRKPSAFQKLAKAYLGRSFPFEEIDL